MKVKFEIGIDEAGRGPLAGPVAVGVAIVSEDFDWSLLPGVGDSKQVSVKNREAIFHLTQKLKKAGTLDYAVALVSAAVIDKKGIVPAITNAMNRALQKLEEKHTPVNRGSAGDFYKIVSVKLDGGLYAPKRFLCQETIIKGDSKEKVIGLASIMAKVTRDAYMRRVAARPAFTPYDFARHKGYGTKSHRASIATHGLSPEHRRTFCRNIKVVV